VVKERRNLSSSSRKLRRKIGNKGGEKAQKVDGEDYVRSIGDRKVEKEVKTRRKTHPNHGATARDAAAKGKEERGRKRNREERRASEEA